MPTQPKELNTTKRKVDAKKWTESSAYVCALKMNKSIFNNTLHKQCWLGKSMAMATENLQTWKFGVVFQWFGKCQRHQNFNQLKRFRESQSMSQSWGFSGAVFKFAHCFVLWQTFVRILVKFHRSNLLKKVWIHKIIICNRVGFVIVTVLAVICHWVESHQTMMNNQIWVFLTSLNRLDPWIDCLVSSLICFMDYCWLQVFKIFGHFEATVWWLSRK